MTAVLVQLGQRIRKRRTELTLSQEMLAERAGLHRTYVSSMERGERNVSLVNLLKVAAALDIPLEVLIAGMTLESTGA